MKRRLLLYFGLLAFVTSCNTMCCGKDPIRKIKVPRAVVYVNGELKEGRTVQFELPRALICDFYSFNEYCIILLNDDQVLLCVDCGEFNKNFDIAQFYETYESLMIFDFETLTDVRFHKGLEKYIEKVIRMNVPLNGEKRYGRINNLLEIDKYRIYMFNIKPFCYPFLIDSLRNSFKFMRIEDHLWEDVEGVERTPV